jgi:hypothetical protein
LFSLRLRIHSKAAMNLFAFQPKYPRKSIVGRERK